jgi:4-amino-4-deoxy-L-arabinose transferase-like glycosyltransferase
MGLNLEASGKSRIVLFANHTLPEQMIPPDTASNRHPRPSSPQGLYSDVAANAHSISTRAENLLPLFVLISGLIARLVQAQKYFLNPDEALHNMLASPSSLRDAYRAALTNAHPPLLILVLHYWRWLGRSELWLRMPSVLAGTACCWIAYRWLKLVTDRATAVIGLICLAFAPALIELSAEIRQYSLLLFFMAACLCLAERAIRENSLGAMVLFTLALYGALLTHYSSLLFAFTMGIYMVVRLWPYRHRKGLFTVWLCGQVGGVALATYYIVTHVAHLRENGLATGIAETWLRKSILHPGVDNAAIFVVLQTLRVFTYLFSHGVVGAVALLTFLAGIASLLRSKSPLTKKSPTARQLALLFGLPFAANCALALAGLYPYGATRHNAFLAPFAVGGVSVGLASWVPTRNWIKPIAVILVLAFCNFFPAPPPLIKARNHSRRLMQGAMNTLRQSAPAGSIVFSDYQSGLLLGYYACGHEVLQILPPYDFFVKADCGRYRVITERTWKFYGEDFPNHLASLGKTEGLAPGTRIWFFDAGWITDSTPKLREQLRQFGCPAPQTFGENILLCQVTIGGSAQSAEIPSASNSQ